MISMARIGSKPTPFSSSVLSGFRAILPSAAHRGGRFFYSAGFSLLELLLVLFIMGLMTATTMLMTGGMEDQSKYDETKRRMELIKRAIVGDPTRTVNGGPEISGFVADMGRLPGCLRELIEPKDCNVAPGNLQVWQLDAATSSVWVGWHGPYLEALPDSSDGAKRFRDGWGNSGNDTNYGWIFGTHTAPAGSDCGGVSTTQPTDGSRVLQSCGADGKTGGAELEADYPASGNLLLVRKDHDVHLDEATFTATLRNQSGTARPAANLSIKLRIIVPDGSGNTTTKDSDLFALATSAVPANGQLAVGFQFSGNQWAPWGVRAVELICDPSGEPFDGNCDTTDNTDGPIAITLIPYAQQSPIPIIWKIQ